MTRQRKSDRQRAEERLGVEERRVTKLTAQRDEAKGRLQFLDADLAIAVKRRDFLKQSPDLPAPVAPRPARQPKEEAKAT